MAQSKRNFRLLATEGPTPVEGHKCTTFGHESRSADLNLGCSPPRWSPRHRCCEAASSRQASTERPIRRLRRAEVEILMDSLNFAGFLLPTLATAIAGYAVWRHRSAGPDRLA